MSFGITPTITVPPSSVTSMERMITHWPYFDYVASTKVIKEARGGADYTFTELQKLVIGEYETYMKTN
jgi:hypothetical protein